MVGDEMQRCYELEAEKDTLLRRWHLSLIRPCLNVWLIHNLHQGKDKNRGVKEDKGRPSMDITSYFLALPQAEHLVGPQILPIHKKPLNTSLWTQTTFDDFRYGTDLQ